jgi:malate dehydrogenase (oxaloacetate-decarboxylating)(NADP+)
MVEAGLSREEAMSRFCVLTADGTLGAADGKNSDPNHVGGITDLMQPWINPSVSDGTSLVDAIKQHKPTILLGLTTAKGVFNEEVLNLMAELNEAPIIMPMSNPTAKAECTAEEAYIHTDGRAIVATGSPFPPVEYKGKILVPSQCNNMYIFPGIGLAASVAGLTQITDRMLYLAAEACTNSMTEQEVEEGRTFPNIERIRDVSATVAVAIIEEGIRADLCTKITKRKLAGGIANLVKSKMYYPMYVPLVSKLAGR